MKPRTLWACQLVAFMISASVAPLGRFNRSMIFAALLPSRAAPAFRTALGAFLGALAFGAALAALALEVDLAVRALWGNAGLFAGFRLVCSRLGGAGFFDGHVVSFCGDRRTHMDHSDRPHKQANSSGKAGEEIGIKAETTSWRNFR